MSLSRPWWTAVACSAASGLWLPAALAQDGWDACKMLRQADVETAFAPRQFDAGTAVRSAVKPSPKTATVTECVYTSKGATAKDLISVTLLARRAPSDAIAVSPQVARAGAVKLKATPVDVPGLGAGAYSVNLGSQAFPIVELNVFRGPRDWLVFGASGMKLSPEAALDGLRKAAAATTSRL